MRAPLFIIGKGLIGWTVIYGAFTAPVILLERRKRGTS